MAEEALLKRYIQVPFSTGRCPIRMPGRFCLGTQYITTLDANGVAAGNDLRPPEDPCATTAQELVWPEESREVSRRYSDGRVRRRSGQWDELQLNAEVNRSALCLHHEVYPRNHFELVIGVSGAVGR